VLALGRRAGNQLDHRLADRVERQPPPLIGFRAAQRNAEAVFPQLPALLDVANDDADVLDALDFHGWPFGAVGVFAP
jgi:hypothetical protein